MQNENRIHLVPRPEPRPMILEVPEPPAEAANATPTLDPKDIVRETLAIARECVEVLASTASPRNQLLVDLVASLAVARLKKRGQR